jgi:hypothetical protein
MASADFWSGSHLSSKWNLPPQKTKRIGARRDPFTEILDKYADQFRTLKYGLSQSAFVSIQFFIHPCFL